MNLTMFILEVLGTISFSVSGAIAGIKKDMDLLGILTLAVITATGGGAIRDITLGLTPPLVFRNPVYLVIAIVTTALFIIALKFFGNRSYFNIDKTHPTTETIFNMSDAIGLAVFSVSGVAVALENGFSDNVFLVLFVGAITGVGGGVVRDVFTMNTPSIFVRHIYALASLIGAIVYYLLWSVLNKSVAMVITVVIVTMIRHYSRKYKMSLPKVSRFK